jgi:hypothetical protein
MPQQGSPNTLKPRMSNGNFFGRFEDAAQNDIAALVGRALFH